jgi:tetratricopeptide (TPR) repeat protein
MPAPSSGLSGLQLKQLQQALLSAFPTRSSLAQMLRLGLDVNLEQISGGSTQAEVVFDLIRWAEATGHVNVLIEAARAQNPSNSNLEILAKQIRPAESIAPVELRSEISRATLRRVLDERFTLDELRVLAYGIGVDTEELPGEGKSGKSRELIAYLERRGRLEDLIREIRRSRPDIRLEEVVEPERPTPPIPSVQEPRLRPTAPPPSPNFTDRDLERTAAAEALSRVPGAAIAALVGMGGVGKSALALQIAADLDADFPGGVLWATLGPSFDLFTVFANWAQIIGVTLASSRDPKYQASILRSALEEWQRERGRLLIALDDLWDEETARALREAFPPDSAVLFTTRNMDVARSLRARIIELNALPEDAALVLIEGGLGPLGRYEASARELIQLVGGLPLAIELAVRQVQRPADLPALVERLRRDPSLSTLRLSVGVGREITLESAFAPSVKALSGLLERRFRLLGAFEPERFDLPAIMAVWEETRRGVAQDHLQLLANEALVSRTGDDQIYGQHAALHAYALALLESSKELPDARLRHAGYYLTLARQSDWRTVEANDRQIRLGWKTALALGGPLMLDYLRTLDKYFVRRGQWRDLLEWSQAALAVLDPGDDAGRLLCLGDVAAAFVGLTRLDEALSASMQQLALAQRLNDKVAEADATVRMGSIYRTRGQYADARSWLERGRQLLEGTSDGSPLVNALMNLGLLARTRGVYDQALDYFNQALKIAQGAGDQLGEAAALNFLGSLYRRSGQLEAALDHYGRSRELAKTLGDAPGEAKALNSIGDIYRDQGRLSEAQECFEASLRIARELGNREQEATALQNLGKLLRAQGKPDTGLEALIQAEAIWTEIGDRSSLLSVLNDEGLTLFALGKGGEARERLERALALARELENPPDEAMVLTNLGVIATAQADWTWAQNIYNQVLRINESINDRGGMAAALANLGRVATSLQQWDLAVKYYRQGQAIARETGDRGGEAVALTNIAALMDVQGDPDNALNYYQRAIEIQQQLGDTAGIARTQDSIAAIQLRRGQVQTTLSMLMLDSQRFFQAAGFRLNTTGETNSFLCTPTAPTWHSMSIRSDVYALISVGTPLDAAGVLSIQKAAAKASPTTKHAFVIIDKTVEISAWQQIATERTLGFEVVPFPQTLLYESRATGKPWAERTALREHLVRYLGQGQDPYEATDPVYDVNTFFGRDAKAKELVERLMVGASIGVFGLRKMGKSSLMRYMQPLMPCPTAWVYLRAGTEPLTLYQEILGKWQADAESKSALGKWAHELGLTGVTLNAANPSDSFKETFTATLDRICGETPDARLAVFLDEIDQFMPAPDADSVVLEKYLAVMRVLRDLTQVDRRLSLMVAGVDPAVNRRNKWGPAQNPFFQLVREEFLQPLLPEDLALMVRTIGSRVELSYSDAATDYIADCSGGHPFLARRLCSVAYAMRGSQPGDVPLEVLRRAAEQLIFAPRYAVMTGDVGLWQEAGDALRWGEVPARANQAILVALARAEEPPAEAELIAGADFAARRTALYALKELSLIRTSEQDPVAANPHYRITYGLFRDWLRRVQLGLTG